jgi:acetyl-CoA carboxylase biotin carboxyl carrier protein
MRRETMFIDVEAPLAGTVFRIETEVGADVSEGEVVLVLESMKMELPIKAPAAGRVLEIRVERGQSVQEGDVLLVLG